MIQETGQVTAVADGAVWVNCVSRSDCQRCAEGRGCGGAIMGRLLGDRQHQVQVVCQSPLPKIGDQVSLSLDESLLLRGALVAYLLPLAGLLAGALTGQLVGGEFYALTGGGTGFVLACAIARLVARRLFGNFQPLARLR